jgi:hypothetical protein
MLYVDKVIRRLITGGPRACPPARPPTISPTIAPCCPPQYRPSRLEDFEFHDDIADNLRKLVRESPPLAAGSPWAASRPHGCCLPLARRWSAATARTRSSTGHRARERRR